MARDCKVGVNGVAPCPSSSSSSCPLISFLSPASFSPWHPPSRGPATGFASGVQGLGFEEWGVGLGAWGLGSRVWGSGPGSWGFGFGGLGFRVRKLTAPL